MRRASHLLIAFCASLSIVAQTPADPAYRNDPKFQKVLADLKDPHLSVDDKLSKWRKANKIAGNACTECLHEIVTLDAKSGQWKDEIKDGQAFAAIASEPADKFYAESAIGSATLHLNNDKPKPEQLHQGDLALQAALAIRPNSASNLYAEGRTLALLGKFDEAKAVFTHYLDIARPHDVYRTRVEHFAADPHLAALDMAPAFTIHTTDGQEFSLDSLQGKVVLLDFWASWCGPCRQTLPEVKRIAAKFAGQPFVVLSISIDRDEDAWKKAMQEEAMTWPQYRDADGKLANAYAAQSIPRFFTIDSDGALQSVKIGSDESPEAGLKKLIAKATDAQRKQAIATDKAAGQ